MVRHGRGRKRPLVPDALPDHRRRHQHRQRAHGVLQGDGRCCAVLYRFCEQGPVLRRRGDLPGRPERAADHPEHKTPPRHLRPHSTGRHFGPSHPLQRVFWVRIRGVEGPRSFRQYLASGAGSAQRIQCARGDRGRVGIGHPVRAGRRSVHDVQEREPPFSV